MEERANTAEEISVLIGIDWADKENACRLRTPGSTKSEPFTLKQTPEALAEWMAQIMKKYPAGKIAIALEQFRGALAFFLMQFDRVVLYMINPKALAKFREAFRVSGAKDDPDDAEALLNMITFHRDKLRPWLAEDEQTRKLRLLTEQRREFVDRRTALTNKITNYLKYYFPQALSWAGDLCGKMAQVFFQKWPTLQKIQKAQPSTIRDFYHKHHSRSAELIETRIKEVQQSSAITNDSAIIEAYQLVVTMILKEIAILNEAIEKFDHQIESIFSEHPDHDFFESLPGAGEIIAPRLLAVLGANRDRFDSAQAVHNYSGIAPVRRQSGKTRVISRRIARPVFVAQTFHEWAEHSIPHCTWAHAYYTIQRQRGKGRHAAIRALAFKWIRIIFRCWKLRVPYDENIYLASVLRHNSELAQLLKSA